jgi:hypothetical protein
LARGQIIYAETGKTISNFRYQDSNGNKLGKLEGSNHNSLGLGVRKSINLSKYNVSCGATYNRYSAKGSDSLLGNYYEWDVTYLGISAGFNYEFYRPPINYNEQHGFSFYPKVSVAAEFLLNGSQNLNDEIYNLKGVEEFDKPLFFLRGGAGLNYYISKKYILFIEYMGGKSFLIGDYKNQEQLRLVTHNISVGFSFNLYYLNE